GVSYEWTPASGPGIGGWSQRTGSVAHSGSAAAAEVAFTAPGVYVLTLTASDPTPLTGSDTVTITVTQGGVEPGEGYDPPAGYYAPARPNGVWLTGQQLKSALAGIIDRH